MTSVENYQWIGWLMTDFDRDGGCRIAVSYVCMFDESGFVLVWC